MSLRFAIIKEYRTNLGEHHEDIVYELGEESIVDELVERLSSRLDDARPIKSRFVKPKYTKEEVKAAVVVAFKDVVESFKKISIRIM